MINVNPQIMHKDGTAWTKADVYSEKEMKLMKAQLAQSLTSIIGKKVTPQVMTQAKQLVLAEAHKDGALRNIEVNQVGSNTLVVVAQSKFGVQYVRMEVELP